MNKFAKLALTALGAAAFAVSLSAQAKPLTIALSAGVTILLGVWPTQVLDLAGQASQFVR